MEYQKIIDLSDNTSSQPSKFRAKKICLKQMITHTERIAPKVK